MRARIPPYGMRTDLGIGHALSGTDPALNGPFSLGARAGYVFSVPVYLGVAFQLFAANDYDESRSDGTHHISASSISYGLEVGYDFRLWALRLRPYLGLGSETRHSYVTAASGTAERGTIEEGGGAVLGWPGLLLQYEISPVVIGLDVRDLMGQFSYLRPAALLTVGLRFAGN